MHLKFVSLRLKRFRSFLNETTLFFDKSGPGLYFIKGNNKTNLYLGSNGSGKSSLIDALLWCLYGKTVQGLKNPDIVPWSGKGTTEVEVTICIDSKTFRIKRTVSPNLLTIDDVEAGQEYVSKLISIPFEILPYTIILGQGQPLFFDLKASEKLKLFSEVLELDRWEDRSKIAADETSLLDREIASEESKLEAALNAQRQADSDFKALKLQSQQWEEKRAEQLSNAESDKEKLQKQIEAVMNERDTADLMLDRAETELKASPLETLRTQYSATARDLTRLELELKSAVRSKAKCDDDLVSIEDCICPTCLQATNKEVTKRLRVELTKAIKTYDVQIFANQGLIEKTKLALGQVLEKFQIEEKAAKQFRNDANQARNILDRLLPKISDWQAEIKALEKQLQSNEEDSNPHTSQLQTLRRRRDQYKNDIEQSKKAIETNTAKHDRTKFWVKGFKDIKLLATEEILQELELLTNSLIEEAGLVGWQVNYDIEKETKSGTISRGLNITVLSPDNKKPVKWEVWSGGEAQRLRLIGTTALSSVLLNHVGVSVNLEIFDEPTVGLSKEGISDLVEMLAQRAKDTSKSIFLVDHHTVQSTKFVETILVTKDKTGSSLEIL